MAEKPTATLSCSAIDGHLMKSGAISITPSQNLSTMQCTDDADTSNSSDDQKTLMIHAPVFAHPFAVARFHSS